MPRTGLTLTHISNEVSEMLEDSKEKTRRHRALLQQLNAEIRDLEERLTGAEDYWRRSFNGYLLNGKRNQGVAP